MKKSKSKNKDILKVTVLSLLAIALFAAVSMGVNQLAFVSATGKTTPVPLRETTFDTASYTNTRQDEQQAEPKDTEAIEKIAEIAEAPVFVPPAITVIHGTHHHDYVEDKKHLIFQGDKVTIPDSAIPIEEAAQIGARYIWDVFGESIDGMYVKMRYIKTPASSKARWIGDVHLTQELADADEYGSSTPFSFMIHAETGTRADITCNMVGKGMPDRYIGFQEHRAWRQLDETQAIYDLDEDELMVYLGVTLEQLEAYVDKATQYTQGHFHDSNIVKVMLGQNIGTEDYPIMYSGISMAPIRDENGSIYPVFTGISVTITDEYGREAKVYYGIVDGVPDSINISTQHNDIDIAPDYYDDIPGLG